MSLKNNQEQIESPGGTDSLEGYGPSEE